MNIVQKHSIVKFSGDDRELSGYAPRFMDPSVRGAIKLYGAARKSVSRAVIGKTVLSKDEYRFINNRIWVDYSL